MGEFKPKEGLFEYSVKRLAPDVRHDALRRLERAVPLSDESLKRFLNIDTADNEAAPGEASQAG
jgi:hypothetical protein